MTHPLSAYRTLGRNAAFAENRQDKKLALKCDNEMRRLLETEKDPDQACAEWDEEYFANRR